jgi:hypothetical protein
MCLYIISCDILSVCGAMTLIQLQYLGCRSRTKIKRKQVQSACSPNPPLLYAHRMPVAVGTCGARGVPRRLVPRRGILLSAPPRRNRCVLLLGDAVCSSHIMQRFRLARVCHIHRHTCRSPSAASSNEGLVDSDAGGIQHERTDGAAAEGVASHPGNDGRIAAWHGESRRVAVVVLAAVGARREGRVRQRYEGSWFAIF